MPSRKTCSAPEVHLLGEIVVAFGNLELFLETSLWQLLASEDDRERFRMVQALTARMSFGRKVDAFVSMFREKGVAQAERELAALAKDLFDAEKERNQLIHSAWNYTNIWGGSSFMRMKATANSRRGLKRGFHRMPPGRIEETLRRIEEAAQSLAQFTVAYIQAAEASENEGR